MSVFAGFDCYGGATITRVVDGADAEWIGCCAKHNGVFGCYVFKDSVHVPLMPFCTGRGSIEENGYWIAWDGSVYHTGALPGFTPIPKSDTSALEAQVAALQQQVATLSQTIASLPPTTTGPVVRVPAQGPVVGGGIQLAATVSGGPWCFDVVGGTLRIHRNGVVVQRWTLPEA